MESIWSKSCTFPGRERLDGDHVVQVAVIGSGMAGLLTAYLLKKQGLDVAVLEGSTTASGMTKNTTAKITCQHSLIYRQLIDNFGVEKAAQYAWANQRAIKMYRDIIAENNIDCELETKSAYLYTLGDAKPLKDELDAARTLKIEAELTTKTGLPFPVKSALRFADQAQFNPSKFLKAISADLTIYEHTMAREIQGDVVITDHGRVTADQIVIASHFPFLNVPGWYFARMHQERSYVLALENAAQVDGMYLSIDTNNAYSFRNYGDLLIFGGGAHRSGKHPQASSYEKLRKAAKKFYPKSKEICNWSAQDCVTWDNVPYIGRFAETTPNLFVATGFKKWGMTTSMASAMILTDMICGRENDCADVFSPQRFNMGASAKNLFTDAGQSVAGLTTGLFSAPSRRCAHLGCRLHWNPDENTWDCPCHGSRYTKEGKLINNPALKGLKHE